jgi:hypothetical protein
MERNAMELGPEKLGEVVEKVGEALALGDAASLLFAVYVVLP